MDIEEYAFVPKETTVPPGTTVKFTNQDPTFHTVTPKNASLWGTGGSPMLEKSDSWSFMFTEPGRYEYYCRPHAFMVGVVIVSPQADATALSSSNATADEAGAAAPART